MHAASEFPVSVKMASCMFLAGSVALPRASRNLLVLLQRLRPVRALPNVWSELRTEEIFCTLLLCSLP